MFERDYLMRLLMDFFAALANSMNNVKAGGDPRRSAEHLEDASCAVTDIDPSVLLCLSPESISTILQVSGTTKEAALFFARGMDLAAEYRNAAGDETLAQLRKQQAQAVANAYGFELAQNPEDFSDLEDQYLNKQ